MLASDLCVCLCVFVNNMFSVLVLIMAFDSCWSSCSFFFWWIWTWWFEDLIHSFLVSLTFRLHSPLLLLTVTRKLLETFSHHDLLRHVIACLDWWKHFLNNFLQENHDTALPPNTLLPRLQSLTCHWPQSLPHPHHCLYFISSNFSCPLASMYCLGPIHMPTLLSSAIPQVMSFDPSSGRYLPWFCAEIFQLHHYPTGWSPTTEPCPLALHQVIWGRKRNNGSVRDIVVGWGA